MQQSAKFILKKHEEAMRATVEAMTCKAIRTNFHGNELYINKQRKLTLYICPLQQNKKYVPFIRVFRVNLSNSVKLPHKRLRSRVSRLILGAAYLKRKKPSSLANPIEYFCPLYY